ncbi:MAG: phenylalanine--tRNA ligase subunit alpha [Planctomycetes bacterium]|nr:phenylalanine--tRNA ligase subunit alpha [Planctomycetota bacterium]
MSILHAIESVRAEFQRTLRAVLEEAGKNAAAGGGPGGIESLRVRFLGRKGQVTALMARLKEASAEERPQVGKALNQLRQEIEEGIQKTQDSLEALACEEELRSEWVDITLDLERRPLGSLHPLTRIQYDLEDAFTSMGFEVLDGPHVETDYFNFEALNIPAHHPARDMQDTFYLEDGNLLRTHTSPIQVRGMMRLRPPFKIIGPGKVFRCERIDASHEVTFHQLEGMMVDRDIKVAHLIYFGKALLSRIFKKEVEVRLRPGYFPFVEPGFELDIRCLICGGPGCQVCKGVGWVELLPCGLIHPNVLRSGKIDPEEYSGFAFGLGLDRLVMMKFQIDDIRHLHSADLRFLKQFP